MRNKWNNKTKLKDERKKEHHTPQSTQKPAVPSIFFFVFAFLSIFGFYSNDRALVRNFHCEGETSMITKEKKNFHLRLKNLLRSHYKLAGLPAGRPVAAAASTRHLRAHAHNKRSRSFREYCTKIELYIYNCICMTWLIKCFKIRVFYTCFHWN